MKRRLAAILAADVVGYSRLMSGDEEGTLSKLSQVLDDVIQPLITSHNGRVFKLMGDGILAEFASAVDALNCALEWQNTLAVAAPIGSADSDQLQFRIGVNLGEIIVREDDIFGNGVNLAARLEALSEPGGICISEDVHRQTEGAIDAKFEDMGAQQLKNIDKPVNTYRLVSAGQPVEPARADDAELAPTQRPSIAVLALTNMSGDPEQEYFSDGISEDIITELSRNQELFVIARNSSFSYKGKSIKIQEIGEDLGVDYVVEGSVRKSGRTLRITVQLIEAETGNHIWAEKYDRELEDIFEVQDEISHAIVAVLPVRIKKALVDKVRTMPSENLTAYDYFMRADWLYKQSSVKKTGEILDMLGKAIEIDPTCAPAYALIARVHAYSVFTFSPIGDDPTIVAQQHIKRALELGEDIHFVQLSAGHIYSICGMHDLAKLHSDKAIALNPNEFSGLISRGGLITYLGDPREGVNILTKALGHDPLTPDFHYEDLAEAYYMLKEYEKAIEIYQRWQDPPIHMYTHLAACNAQLGRDEEARRAAKIFEDGRPKGSDFSFYAAAHARLCKRQEDADHWLDGYRKAGLID
ncbi:MAG: adenylate/guanylate cyclase domain-containing protein [Rhizobiaceae bacterium]